MEDTNETWRILSGSHFHRAALCGMKWGSQKSVRKCFSYEELDGDKNPSDSGPRGLPKRRPKFSLKSRNPSSFVSVACSGGFIAVLTPGWSASSDNQYSGFDGFNWNTDSKNEVSEVGTKIPNWNSDGISEVNLNSGIGNGFQNATLSIFSSTGEFVKDMHWNFGQPAPGGFGWVLGGMLVCVLADGKSFVLIRGFLSYSQISGLGGEKIEYRVIGMPMRNNDFIDRQVACAQVWMGGFVAVTEGYQIVEGFNLSSSSGFTVRIRASLGSTLLGDDPFAIPQTIAVLRPLIYARSPDMAPICIGNPKQAGVVVIESDGQIRSHFASCGDSETPGVSISHMLVPHPTIGLIASYGIDGILSVLPMDFYESVVTCDCQAELEKTQENTWNAIRLPDSVHWCDTSTFSIAVLWSENTPWSGERNAGMLLLSLESCSVLLNHALRYGSFPLSDMYEKGQEKSNANPHDGLPASDDISSVSKSLREGKSILQYSAKFTFPGRCVATSEIDGVRVACLESSYIVRAIPDSVSAIFRLGSTDPSAMLVDAFDMMESNDSSADAALQSLIDSNKVATAVNACLDAASFATSYGDGQERMLRVAAYGKRFFHLSYDGRSIKARRSLSKRFVNISEECFMVSYLLRRCGIVMTVKQLRMLTPRVLIDRLLYQGKFHDAYVLCKYANVSVSHVVTFWASAAIHKLSIVSASSVGALVSDGKSVENSDSNSSLLDTIVKRIDHCYKQYAVRVPIAPIAAVAAALGNRDLALDLIKKERNLTSHILLLLRIQEFEQALLNVTDENISKGIDPDLRLFVVHECVNGLPKNRIANLCATNPLIFYTFTRLHKATDRNEYKLMLLYLDKKKDKASVLATESCASIYVKERVSLLKEAADEYTKSGNQFFGKMSYEHAKLLEEQQDMNSAFIGLSLANTVQLCIQRGLNNEAEKLAMKFGLEPRAYRLAQLRGLAARKDWARITNLCSHQSVRAVIDDADIADIFIKVGRNEDATTFIDRLDDSHERKGELYFLLGNHEQAIEAAYKLGNIGLLERIRRHKPTFSVSIKEKLESIGKEGPRLRIAGDDQMNSIINRAHDSCAQQ